MPDTADLTYAECRTVLDDTGVGKVAVSTPMGPRIIAVNYVVVGGCIVFRTPPFSVLGTYACNATLAFEVGEVDEGSRTQRSVVAVGRAAVVRNLAEIRHIRDTGDPEPWSDERRWTYLKLPWSDLRGTRMRVAG